jgi:sugar phosphate isomerase/epimerase
MATTRTGSFPIGFRRGWGDWQRDLPQLMDFARQNRFDFLDFGPAPVEELKQVVAAGIRIGSVDLMGWKDMLSPDAGRRRAAVQANVEYVRALTQLGIGLFLTVMQPEDPARPRRENFDFAVNSYGELLRNTGSTGAKVLLEGAPGGPPHFGSIACTPADLRALFGAIGSDRLGVNFDPSHLVRQGIDPQRFVAEFTPRIYHAHAKDTELLAEGLYDHGNVQQATFDKPRRFGAHCWRYALPGRGAVPWGALFSQLAAAGYRGLLSIELEDEDFTGSDELEQRGLIKSREFLENA